MAGDLQGKDRVEKLSLDPVNSNERVSEYLADKVETAREKSEAERFIDEARSRIEARVAELKLNGKFPASKIDRMNRIYQQLLPKGTGKYVGDFEAAYKLTDRVAFMDVDVPTESRKPIVGIVKKVLRLSMAWYLTYLAQQFNNFTSNLMRLVTVFDGRLNRIETELDRRSFPPLDLLGETVSVKVADAAIDVVAKLLSDTSGRICHLEAGSGGVAKALRDLGLNVYGVETRHKFIDAIEKAGVELVIEAPMRHLNTVKEKSLAAIVLSGVVDRASNNDRVDLLQNCATVLSPGSHLILLLASSSSFDDPSNHIEHDLSTGRPLAVETWTFLLDLLGFDEVRIVELDDDLGSVVTAKRSSVVGANKIISGVTDK
ncbi:MAG: methyltransferase domain-containing protein [Actinomycetota bacterium]|nr:methyltransferase domain-containing protein [Actinomycetota bacterium]